MPFPFTNLANAKKRPVLLLRKLDNSHDDWLVCMISSQLHQFNPDLDWKLDSTHPEFAESGLKTSCVFALRGALAEGLSDVDNGRTVTLGTGEAITDYLINRAAELDK